MKTTVGEFHALRPVEYGDVVSFEYFQYETDDWTISAGARLVLGKLPTRNMPLHLLSGKRLRLVFHEVRDVRLSDLGAGSTLCLDITEAGDEFLVGEEHGDFCLFCRWFEAEVEDVYSGAG